MGSRRRSDTLEGQTGWDVLRFNGSAGAEIAEASANGTRLVFTCTPIVMDVDGVEQWDYNALGSNDSIHEDNAWNSTYPAPSAAYDDDKSVKPSPLLAARRGNFRRDFGKSGRAVCDGQNHFQAERKFYENIRTATAPLRGNPFGHYSARACRINYRCRLRRFTKAGHGKSGRHP